MRRHFVVRRSGDCRHMMTRRSRGRILSLAVVLSAVGFAPSSADEALHIAPPLDAPAPSEPSSYRTNDYRKPVPLTLAGARVLSPQQALELWTTKSAVFIDVYPRAPKPPNLPPQTIWREPPHYTIEGAKWLPNVGYGVLSAENEAYFKTGLQELTGGDASKAVVFFCLRNCWMSWNAGKRAMTLGYTSVYWFRDGVDAWQEMGQLVVDAKPEALSKP